MSKAKKKRLKGREKRGREGRRGEGKGRVARTGDR